MKKSLSILLSLLIMISSSGFCLSIDYCPHKKKSTVSLVGMKTGCCKGKTSHSCCTKTIVDLKKVTDNYNSPSQIVQTSVNWLFVSVFFNSVISKSDISKPVSYLTGNSPPIRQVSLNILYRTFLI